MIKQKEIGRQFLYLCGVYFLLLYPDGYLLATLLFIYAYLDFKVETRKLYRKALVYTPRVKRILVMELFLIGDFFYRISFFTDILANLFYSFCLFFTLDLCLFFFLSYAANRKKDCPILSKTGEIYAFRSSTSFDCRNWWKLWENEHQKYFISFSKQYLYDFKNTTLL